MVATATKPPDRASSPPAELHLLWDPADTQRIHPMFSRLHLSVFHVSGAKGIPDNVTEIPFLASRLSTRKTYQSAWRRWSGWCVKRTIDSLSVPLSDVLLHLTEYFNSKAAYRSVNVARSAISTTHAKLNGLPEG